MATPPPLLPLPVILAALLLLHAAQSLAIGVNYGTLADNLPPPSQVAAFLRKHTYIDGVKLFDSNPDFIRAFANTGISVVITAADGDIPALARLPAARAWVASHVRPFYPATNITLVAVGNEVMATEDKNLIAHLLPAMRSLTAALAGAGMGKIRVSTPHALSILSVSEPPSAGRFRRGYDRAIFAPMLEFHRRTRTPFVVNPYPYFGYGPGTRDYTLFRPNAGIVDRGTGVNYTNMFDALMDAVHSATKRLGYGDVDLAVGETGWPSAGDPGQAGVSPEDALSYNRNLIRHVNADRGTPLMPHRRFETYIFALFNEDQKPGPTAERNFGLFRPDLSPVYDVGLMRAPTTTPPGRRRAAPSSGKKWCVAKAGASDAALQANIDYVCGTGAVDCGAIRRGGACFLPDTLRWHASYVMNAYFQSAGRHDFNCDFARTGAIAASDPSRGRCRYGS